MSVFSRYRTLLALLFVLPLTGCLFRSRKIEQQLSKTPLRVAAQADLIRYLAAQSAKIQSMQATVDIDTSVGGARKGKVTDYQQIRGYVLARKPAMLRMIGLVPLVRNRAFDMVSDGNTFKVWIPSKNRFVIGRNDGEPHNTGSSLENLRPQQIYDALLLRDVDPENEIAVMEDDMETVTDAKGHRVQQPDYELVVIRKGSHGWFLSRKIVFSRIDLLPHRQLIYDESGTLITNARYDAYKEYEGTLFSSQIEIVRPQEEYDITLTMIKLEFNEPLADDKFVLDQPPGAQVVHMGGGQSSTPTAANNGSR